jgi:hypothetical protein
MAGVLKGPGSRYLLINVKTHNRSLAVKLGLRVGVSTVVLVAQFSVHAGGGGGLTTPGILTSPAIAGTAKNNTQRASGSSFFTVGYLAELIDT